MITRAPWFVTNAQIHKDLEVPVFSDYTLALARRTFERASRSENPLIQHLDELNPDRPPPRVAMRRVLEDP